MKQKLIEAFQKVYGDTEGVKVYFAPGRVNMIGEHTDYNGGHVFPCALTIGTYAAVKKREDRKLRFFSLNFENAGVVETSLDDLVPAESAGWTNYPKGVIWAFAGRGMKLEQGLDVVIYGNIPNGSGLSSSAAVEVLIAEIFNNLYNEDKLDAVELAKIGQYAENVYFGKPSGLLDQMCCAYGGIIGIDFKDNKNPVVTPLQVDFSEFELSMVITDTKGCHADLTHEYAAVPPEMREIAHFYGKDICRDVEPKDFFRDIAKIRETVKNDRAILRAYHFFTENMRVRFMLEELKNDDIDTFLYNVTESGNSSFRFLQNVYPSSAPKEQGLSLAIAVSENILQGEGAVRVHGGGFAGTIQAYVPDHLRDRYIQEMENLFGEGCCTIIAIRKIPVGRIY